LADISRNNLACVGDAGLSVPKNDRIGDDGEGHKIRLPFLAGETRPLPTTIVFCRVQMITIKALESESVNVKKHNAESVSVIV
jgi:hypothetical protein